MLPYQPPRPRKYNPPIALIGCGGVSTYHLAAYRQMKLNVVALCDRHLDRAEARRKEFFPKARFTPMPRDVLRRDDIEVVDITLHPRERTPLILRGNRRGEARAQPKAVLCSIWMSASAWPIGQISKNVKLAVNLQWPMGAAFQLHSPGDRKRPARRRFRGSSVMPLEP